MSQKYTKEFKETSVQLHEAGHVETVALLSKLDVDKHISVKIELDELDLTSAESKATYAQNLRNIYRKIGLKSFSTLILPRLKRNVE